MKRQNQTLNAMVDKLTAEKETLALENTTLNTGKMAWDAERKQLLAELAKYNTKNNDE